nr:MAG TPA: hypothetical protein [Bacteriophage sp.]
MSTGLFLYQSPLSTEITYLRQRRPFLLKHRSVST